MKYLSWHEKIKEYHADWCLLNHGLDVHLGSHEADNGNFDMIREIHRFEVDNHGR